MTKIWKKSTKATWKLVQSFEAPSSGEFKEATFLELDTFKREETFREILKSKAIILTIPVKWPFSYKADEN